MPKWVEEDDEDVGEWFPYQKDEATGVVAQARIRAIPASFDKRLRGNLLGSATQRKLESQRAIELIERRVQIVRERATYALAELKDFPIKVGGKGTAAKLSDLLGKPVQPFETILLQGALSDDLKDALLRALPAFAEWVSDRADKQSKQEADEEEVLGKT